MTTLAETRLSPGVGRWWSRQGWNATVWLLLFVLVAWYATLIPRFGSFQTTSIIKGSLPLVFLSLAQAAIVIGGGIDLGVGALMVLSSSVAAQTMEGQPLGVVLVLAVVISLGAGALNGVVGWIIKTSTVPDIVITLATSFIYSGLALVVLPGPGGGTHEGLRWLFTGSVTGTGSNFWPPIVVMTLTTGLLAVYLQRTRPGLAIYASGSDRDAAYLSGVDVGRSKIRSYAVGGLLVGLAGLANIAITGSGDPRASIGANATLNSVAAIVLGGVALTGGKGSVIGVVAAAIVLFTLTPILSAVGVDPNTAQVVKGSLIVAVMMVGGLLELRRRRAE